MPYVYNLDPRLDTPNKKRKLSQSATMARRAWQEEAQEQRNDEPIDVEMEDVETTLPSSNEDLSRVIRTSSREELIESIKRGENPTWIPNPALEAFYARQNHMRNGTPPDQDPADVPTQKNGTDESKSASSQPSTPQTPSPSAEEIERPRSALHTGDFHEKRTPFTDSNRNEILSDTPEGVSKAPLSHSPPPWTSPFKMPSLSRFHADSHSFQTSAAETTRRARAPSLGSSLSSSFVMRTPTSPLVYSAINAEPDPLARSAVDNLSTSPGKANRRRTLPPESFRTLRDTTDGSLVPNFSRPLPTLRRETSLPHQNHQSHRSLTSFTYQPISTPQTPTFLRSRRSSNASDISPSLHASMVGSFEESILRGRMSTAPSKPLDFVAQIGVLGKGDCKPSLRCPAHVIVPFPAVFYSYPSTAGWRSFSDDSPSPYVGNIDLEHSLKPIEVRRHRRRHSSPTKNIDELTQEMTAPENTAIGRALAREERQKRHRSVSPKGPTGGCYRIPEQGQVQIIIKNPNKTAVKLYLVPYDLIGMEPGTKTFIRQRSFSAGPILEKALTDKPESPTLPDPLKDKHVLRYLIHLKICCPYKGRFYLYDNIRVVFANRVPDGKEKLRNEIQLPEPRFSLYKPGRDSSFGSLGAKLAAEKAFRKRSSSFAMIPALFDAMDGIVTSGVNTNFEAHPPLPSTAAIPFHLFSPPNRAMAKSEPNQTSFAMSPPPTDVNLGRDPTNYSAQDQQPVSAVSGFNPSTSARCSPVPWAGGSSGGSTMRAYSPAPLEAGEGLLARKLRDLQTLKGGGGDAPD